MYDLGDTVNVTAECRDAAGQLANAAAVTLTVTKPDGTTDTPTVTNPPAVVGRYTHPYVTTLPGRYVYRYQFSGGVPAQAWVDVLNVLSSSPAWIVGLAETKLHLNIPAVDTSADDELRGFIASVSEVVEDIVGIVVKRSFVETYSGRGERAILLRRRPVVSVTSVSENGVTVPASDYSPTSAGVLTRATAYSAGRWASGVDNIVVTYVAGRDLTPANVLDGTRDLIRINWRPQVGGNVNPFDQGRGDQFAPSSVPQSGEIRLGFFVPNTVMQRLQPSSRGPHIA